MKTLLSLIGAAGLAALAVASPVHANNLNAPPPGGERFAPGDRGMAIMSAAINADATIARGEGVVSALDLGTGVYEVVFGRDITQCTYQVSVGESGIGGATPAAAGVTRRSGNNAGVFIQIDNAVDGTNVDRDFFVLVYCGR